MIYKEVTKNDFVNEFDTFNRSENFTVAGRKALYDYLYELSEDCYEKGLELDVIALCCEYTEYSDVFEAVYAYTTDFVEGELDYSRALDFLEDKTTVIKFDGGIIIENF